ncbi:hypothetical protein SAMN05445060_3847 [Williamsia sterculiae]|uniref:RAMA domain-containing protein n=1 Tax=Williamsia sterculiae TaxID=1344003 RepID=A0A1N7HB89_9NOCA|nr:hypothetical protein SAMN05445060_3847 [Williamsia sterculiae]
MSLWSQWFQGSDGDVCLDEEFVWLIRGYEPTSGGSPPIEARPRRARLADLDQILKRDYGPLGGWLHIGVRGIEPLYTSAHGAASSCPDCVKYSADARSEFARLYAELAAHARESTESAKPTDSTVAVDSEHEPQHVELPAERPDSVLLALDQLGGIATYEEMRRRVGDLARPRAKHFGLVWRRFGDVHVAIGGTETSSKFQWSREFTELERRVVAVGRNPTVPRIRRAIEGSALKRFDFSRLAAVWEVLSEQISATPEEVAVDGQTDASRVPSASSPTAPDYPPCLQAARPASPTLMSGKESGSNEAIDESAEAGLHDEDGGPSASSSVANRRLRSTFGKNRITLPALGPVPSTSQGPSVVGQRSEFTRDSRLRVIIECEGHFVAGLYDETTGALQITTDGLARSTPYATPTAAAQVVFSRFSQPDSRRMDGSELWTKTNGEPIPRPRR